MSRAIDVVHLSGDEYDRLMDEREILRQEAERAWKEVDAIAKERDALKKEAERYRWLRGDAPPESTRWPRWDVRYFAGASGWQNLLRSELDAAIDAAIKGE